MEEIFWPANKKYQKDNIRNITTDQGDDYTTG